MKNRTSEAHWINLGSTEEISSAMEMKAAGLWPA